MVCLCESGIKAWVSAQPGNLKCHQPKWCSRHLIQWNKGKCLLTTANTKRWIFKQMLSPKTMWPACCAMAVDASCWSINMVWSPISKLSKTTCQPSVDVPVAYHSLAQRHILLLPNEFCCCPSGMCLLHMFSIEVLGTSRRKFGMGLRNTLAQGSNSLISEASGFDHQIFPLTRNLSYQNSRFHHE